MSFTVHHFNFELTAGSLGAKIGTTNWDLFFSTSYPLVNITMENHIFSRVNGKSTISMAIFNSFSDITRLGTQNCASIMFNPPMVT